MLLMAHFLSDLYTNIQTTGLAMPVGAGFVLPGSSYTIPQTTGL